MHHWAEPADLDHWSVHKGLGFRDSGDVAHAPLSHGSLLSLGKVRLFMNPAHVFVKPLFSLVLNS